MSRTSAGIQYNARSMNGIISINADEITCSGTITSDLVKANNLLEADTPEDITAQWTFNTVLPTSTISATTAYQFTNKTYVDSAISGSLTNYVTLGTTQTITGAKTFNTNVRLNNTRNLYLGTTTGGILNYTFPNMYYDINSGGSHYFFVNGSPSTRVESGGLFIENTKYINWYGGSWLYENGASSRFDYRVPSSWSHNLVINSTTHLQVIEDIYGTMWKMPNSTIREQTIYPALVLEVPDTYAVRMTINYQDALKVEYDNTNGSLLTFSGGSILREYLSFSWLLYQLPSSYVLKYQIGGTDIMEVSTSGAIIYESLSMRDGKRIVWDEGFTELAHIRKDKINKYLEYEVASTYRHRFSVNGVDLMSLADGTYGLRTNDIDIFLTRNRHLYMDTSNNGIWIDLTGNFNVMCEPTKSIVLKAGAQQMVSVDATGLIMGVSSLPSTFPKIYADYSKANWIDGNANSLRFNCGSIGSHVFLLNNTLLGYYNTSGFTMSTNNSYLQLGTTSTSTIKHDTATTSLQYKTIGSYNHNFYIDGALYYEMRNDTFRALRGYQNKLGATGAYVANNFNFSWSNPSAGALSVWIDTTRLGNMSIVSDYRLKENIVPARPVLDRLCKIKMIEYEFKNVSIFKKNGISHGFIAHEVAELFPELINIIHGEKDALTDDGLIQPQSVGGELTNLYLSAIQELNAKIEAQQKVIENQQKQIDQLIILFSQSRV